MQHRWIHHLSVPKRLRTTFLNYCNFFREYIAATQHISIRIEHYSVDTLSTIPDAVSLDDTNICLTIIMPEERQQPAIADALRAYFGNIFHDSIPIVHNDTTKYEAELFLVLNKRAVADIRTDIRFYYTMLSEEERKRLVRSLATLTLTHHHSGDQGFLVGNTAEQHAAHREDKLFSDDELHSVEKQIFALRFPTEQVELPNILQQSLRSSEHFASTPQMRLEAVLHNGGQKANQQISHAEEYIKALALQPHPEGGWFRETYRSEEEYEGLPVRYSVLQGDSCSKRAFSTAIYFLLKRGQYSALHRIQSDELWHFYAGAPLLITCIAPNGALSEIRLGKDIRNGEVLQVCIPHSWWLGAQVVDLGDARNDSVGNSVVGSAMPDFSLVGCTVAPGFAFADFEMPSREYLASLFPQHLRVIERLSAPQ